jgi:RNA polymerase sigma factor (sigma-70 family)
MVEVADIDLVREYVANASETAFATLVERHLNLVYSSALRQVRDTQLAQEVTQVVFTILAQKAPRLGRKTVVSGWLYRTTRFAAITTLRTEQRRQKREQEFMQMQSIQSESEPDREVSWEQIAPLVDEVMNELGEKDRNALVLHFFEKKNLREVGQALGTNEDAAQKRVSRAVDKLRGLLARRNAMIPLVALTALLSAQSVQAAPAGLAAAVTASALLKESAVISTLTLAKSTLSFMTWTKTKIAIISVVALLLVLGTTTAVLYPALAKKPPQLQGAWEGALDANGRTLRLVIKVSKTSDDAYSATMDSIEQGARDIPVSEVTYSNVTVRFVIKSLSGDFHGEMNPRGSEIAGIWQQLGMTFPLTLKHTDKPSSLDPPLPMSAYLPRPGSDVQGYWVGDLPQGEARLLRIALKISEPTNGTFTATFDLIDQGLKNLPVASITYTKPHLSFDMAASKTHFEGELNPEGNEISGKWREWRGKPVPVVFSRAEPKQDEIKTGSYTYSNETDLQGFWAGTLNVGGMQLHLLLRIGKLEDGSFTSTMDSIDQGAKDIPTTRIHYTNSEVQLEWQGLGATYNGKLEKGKLLGTFQQRNAAMQLDFARTNLSRP